MEFRGIPQPTIQWIKDGDPLVDGDNVEIAKPQNNPGISLVIIKEATTANNGLYTCTGTNTAGSVSGMINVEVSDHEGRLYPYRSCTLL